MFIALLQTTTTIATVPNDQIFTFHIDLGQVIIGLCIGVIGYLMKTEITSFKNRLDDHDEKLFRLVADVQRLIGITTTWQNDERRNKR